MKQPPISALILTQGVPYFARMLDKIRKHARGELREDYFEMIAQGFDGRYCRFFGVEYAALKARTLQGGTDDEIYAWVRQTGRPLRDEDIAIFSMFCRKRGWRDEATVNLEKNKADSGLAHRTDLVTFFDYYDADEGREKKAN